jgi:hypothetical protein
MGRQSELFDPSGDYLFKPEQQGELDSIVRFWIERHKIYLRRNVLKKDRPWTDDPMLRNYRFCNIYREIDTVSEWIIKNVVRKYEKNENLWFMLAASRLINRTETLQEMMDNRAWPTDLYNANVLYRVLCARAERGDKVVTGAYVVNSVFPKGAVVPDTRKVYYIPYFGLQGLWAKRKELQAAAHTSMQAFVGEMVKCHGWGAFMAYQVAVDLSYSKHWLGKAPDVHTYTSPGPGTTRGMARLMTGGRKPELRGDKLNKYMIKLRDKMNERGKELINPKWWTDDFRTGFAALSMPNVSNSLCEFDKYCRLISGQGEPRSRYQGNK